MIGKAYAALIACQYGRTIQPINIRQRSAMNTKLTLRLDDALIRSAKRYSEKTGKSLSQLVANYFALIESGEDAPDTELTPRVKSLLGALRRSSVGEQDYKRHLEDKHR